MKKIFLSFLLCLVFTQSVFAGDYFDIKSSSKIDYSYQFFNNKIALTPGPGLTDNETDIANKYLAPLLAKKGYQIVQPEEGNDLTGWAGVKFQTDMFPDVSYATLNFYAFKMTSNGMDKRPIINAFAAKKIDRFDPEGLIRELCIEIVKKIPDSRRY